MKDQAPQTSGESGRESLYTTIRRHVELIGGAELELPVREQPREPPQFEE